MIICPLFQILLLIDKQMNNIPDRALLKNLGHWLGILTIAKNKPIIATVRILPSPHFSFPSSFRI